MKTLPPMSTPLDETQLDDPIRDAINSALEQQEESVYKTSLKAGIPVATLSKYLKGEAFISYKYLLILIHYFNITINYGNGENPKPHQATNAAANKPKGTKTMRKNSKSST
jgi:hypothetical protein